MRVPTSTYSLHKQKVRSQSYYISQFYYISQSIKYIILLFMCGHNDWISLQRT